ncbi:MAG: hypothetical protein AAGG81_01680 [Chlamydiota bacterium]
MITFVTYYVDFSEKIIKHIENACKDFSTGSVYESYTKPSKLITTMFESVLKQHENARMVLLTDETTDITLPKFIEVHRVPRKTDRMEIEMLQAKIWLLKKIDFQGHVIFLDPDMIIRDNLEHIFLRTGDLFFTYKKLSSSLEPDHVYYFPINIGFIAVRDKSKLDVINFFTKLLSGFSTLEDEKYHYWVGLQTILRSIFYDTLLEKDKAEALHDLHFNHGRLKIAFLPAEKYNCDTGYHTDIPGDASVLHFKGLRNKPAMMSFWRTIS